MRTAIDMIGLLVEGGFRPSYHDVINKRIWNKAVLEAFLVP
jgi:hypothetical protein